MFFSEPRWAIRSAGLPCCGNKPARDRTGRDESLVAITIAIGVGASQMGRGRRAEVDRVVGLFRWGWVLAGVTLVLHPLLFVDRINT